MGVPGRISGSIQPHTAYTVEEYLNCMSFIHTLMPQKVLSNLPFTHTETETERETESETERERETETERHLEV